VDRVVDTVSAALARNGQSSKAVERWYAEMPREEEMLPKDKYTLFDKKEKSYRKSIHSTFPALCIIAVSIVSCRCVFGLDELTVFLFSRAAQVDSCQPTCEPSWFLRDALPLHMYYTINPTLDFGTDSERNNIWTTGVLAFVNCCAAILKRMVAYNVPLLPQPLDGLSIQLHFDILSFCFVLRLLRRC
jgi:hypothetical protein